MRITAGERTVRAEVASTTPQRAVGLMHRRSLGRDAGMLFLFAAPHRGGFWMKNTLIPLSIAYMTREGARFKVEAILDMEPCIADPCQIYTPGVPWVGALEVNQGFFTEHGVKVGPWRLQHVVGEWSYGEHPTYGVVTIAHWACKDGQPWKVGLGLFLGRGPGKPKDLEIKLAAMAAEPPVIDHLILLRPEEFDVIATPNLNGDYLSDALAAQVGGIGIAPGANIGDTVALFEATHGTAPKYANLDKVNPGSVILSGEMMLRYMGWTEAADLIIRGMDGAIAAKTVTYDFHRMMDGATLLKCSEFAKAVVAKMA